MTARPGRGRLVVALAAAVAASACTATTGGNAPVGGDAGSGCAPAEPQVVQAGGHLLADAEPPVAYSSDPATSGWHAAGRGPAAGAYAEPIPEPAQVSVLERGGVVVALDPDLPPTRAAELRELARTVGDDVDVVVTPHVRPLPDPVTLTAWTVLQRCEDVTAEDVLAFLEAHGDAGEDH